MDWLKQIFRPRKGQPPSLKLPPFPPLSKDIFGDGSFGFTGRFGYWFCAEAGLRSGRSL